MWRRSWTWTSRPCYDFSLDVSDEDRAGFQKTADFMLESGMIEEPFDVNTLFFQ